MLALSTGLKFVQISCRCSSENSAEMDENKKNARAERAEIIVLLIKYADF